MKTIENMQLSGQKCTGIIKYVYENYGEYSVQWIQMLKRGEDDILEGISGLLLSWDKREKRV